MYGTQTTVYRFPGMVHRNLKSLPKLTLWISVAAHGPDLSVACVRLRLRNGGTETKRLRPRASSNVGKSLRRD